jgi:hypothetical protein
MVAWLSEEWAAAAAGLAGLLPPVPGASGTVSLAVIGVAKREVHVPWRYLDGTPVGDLAGVPSDVDLALTLSGPDAVEVITGEVEPSVAFMRGRLKATGDGALLLGFLQSTTRESFLTWRQQVAALAEETSATHGSN